MSKPLYNLNQEVIITLSGTVEGVKIETVQNGYIKAIEVYPTSNGVAYKYKVSDTKTGCYHEPAITWIRREEEIESEAEENE